MLLDSLPEDSFDTTIGYTNTGSNLDSHLNIALLSFRIWGWLLICCLIVNCFVNLYNEKILSLSEHCIDMHTAKWKNINIISSSNNTMKFVLWYCYKVNVHVCSEF
jgi:hypothetical protein